MDVRLINDATISYILSRAGSAGPSAYVNSIVDSHVALVSRFDSCSPESESSELKNLVRASFESHSSSMKNELFDSFGKFEQKLAELDSRVRREMDLVREPSASRHESLVTLVGSLPERFVQTNSAPIREVGKDVERLWADVRSLASMQASNRESLSQLLELFKSLSAKESTSKQSNARGRVGESKLFDLLCERLTSRDDYVVTQCSGISQSCDMKISREGFPDVRIESKAIGMDTGEKVRTCEVEKFRRDLETTSCHGIFVSLHSGIVGKGRFGIEQLPSGKIAVYLSNNEFDIDTIHDMIVLIHRLDPSTSGRTVSTKTLEQCAKSLASFGDKINAAKCHMRETLNLLNDVTFETIARMLATGEDETPPSEKKKEKRFACQCGRDFASAAGLGRHLKACPQGVAPPYVAATLGSCDPVSQSTH